MALDLVLRYSHRKDSAPGMTTEEISAEVDAQERRFDDIRRQLFELKTAEEEALRGGVRGLCTGAREEALAGPASESSGAIHARSPGFKITSKTLSCVLGLNAYRPKHFRPQCTSWTPVSLTPQDILSLDIIARQPARQDGDSKRDADRIVSVSQRLQSLPYDVCRRQPTAKSLITPAVPMSCRTSAVKPLSGTRPVSAMDIRRESARAIVKTERAGHDVRTQLLSPPVATTRPASALGVVASTSKPGAAPPSSASTRSPQQASGGHGRQTLPARPASAGKQATWQARDEVQVHSLEHGVCGKRRPRAQTAPPKRLLRSASPPGSPPQEQQPRRSSGSPGKRGAEASAHSPASCDAAEATGAGAGELLMPPRSWRARLQGRRGAGDEKRVKVVSVTRGDSRLLSFDDQVVPTELVTKLN